jgi:hypothetical protein
MIRSLMILCGFSLAMMNIAKPQTAKNTYASLIRGFGLHAKASASTAFVLVAVQQSLP